MAFNMGSLHIQCFLVLVVVGSAAFAQEGQECSVTTKFGTVLGAVKDTKNPSKKVCSYLGIPFASPPVGPLRFMPPTPPQPWAIPLNATTPPHWCAQGPVTEPGVTISEDCLYLNVYQPRVDNILKKNLPVMVWIHGGAFVLGGSTTYNPDLLMARGDGVILVVIQYRLGLLGFLSTGDAAAPGNYGLKDQSYAIRWVSENINGFGGNGNNITIFGQSAGSSSVAYQLLSPLNKGLFQGAIAQSASALHTWALDRNPAESSRMMATRLGCPATSSDVLVTCIRNLDWQRIIQEQGTFTLQNYGNMTYPVATVTPVVEPDLPGAFITMEPLEIMKTGGVDPSIPVMLGATKHDGSFILAMLYLSRFGPLGLDKNPEYLRNYLVPDVLKFYETEGDSANRGSASSLEMAYLSGVNRSSWGESMPGLVDMLTAYTFKSGLLHTAELLSSKGNRVYLYSFEHHSNNTMWSELYTQTNTPVQGGIAHSDDLMYLFNFNKTLSPDDKIFSDLFCDMWLNFAISGNPTPTPSDRYEQWPVYNGEGESYMKLNSSPTVHSNYLSSWRPNGFEWN